MTVGGLLISVATAFIAKGYSNIMNYVQLLFSYFNAPLFATFIIAMFWRRTTPWAGFWGLIAGFFGAFVTHELDVVRARSTSAPSWPRASGARSSPSSPTRS